MLYHVVDVVRSNLPEGKVRDGFVRRVFGVHGACAHVVRCGTRRLTVDTRHGLPTRMPLHDTYPILNVLHIILCPYNGVRGLQHLLQEASPIFSRITSLELTLAGGQSAHLFPYSIDFQDAVRRSESIKCLQVTSNPLGATDSMEVQSFRVEDIDDANIIANMLSPMMSDVLCSRTVVPKIRQISLMDNMMKHPGWVVAFSNVEWWSSVRSVLVSNTKEVARAVARIMHTNLTHMSFPQYLDAQKVFNVRRSWQLRHLDFTDQNAATVHPIGFIGVPLANMLFGMESIKTQLRDKLDLHVLAHASKSLKSLSLTLGHDEFGHNVSSERKQICLPVLERLYVKVRPGAWDTFHHVMGILVLPELQHMEIEGVPEWLVANDPCISKRILARCHVHDDEDWAYGPAPSNVVFGPNANLHLNHLLKSHCTREGDDEDDEDDDCMSVSSDISNFSVDL